MQHAALQIDLEDTRFVTHFRTKSSQEAFLRKIEHYQWPELKSVLDFTLENFANQPLSVHMFAIVAHKVIPTLSSQTLCRMIQVDTKKHNTKFHRYRLAESPETVEVNFMRRTSVDFTDSAPIAINSNTYYRGCKMTPLIDSFLVYQTDSSATLYLIRILTSKKTNKVSAVQGLDLVTAILKKVTSQISPSVTIRFVIVGPMPGILDLGQELSSDDWKLPEFKTSHEVYRCEIQIPGLLPNR